MKISKTDAGLSLAGAAVAAMGAIKWAADQGYLDDLREIAEAFPNPVTALIAVVGLALSVWNFRRRVDRAELASLRSDVTRLRHDIDRLNSLVFGDDDPTGDTPPWGSPHFAAPHPEDNE